MPSCKYFPPRIVKVRVVKRLEGVFEEYQPVVGGIYEAIFRESMRRGGNSNHCNGSFCIVLIKDKRIIIRESEMEVLEDGK
jgi:hypothetical protein